MAEQFRTISSYRRRAIGATLALLALFAGLRANRPSLAAGLPSKELNLDEFDRLVLAVSADVQIRISDKSHAIIEAEQSVIDAVGFQVEGGTLTVLATRSFQTRHPVRIRISCRGLKALEARAAVDASLDALKGDSLALAVYDSATVTLKGLNLSSLNADLGGSATVKLAGQARSQEVSLAGAGTYDAAALKSQSAVVEASGSGDAVIAASDGLDVDVSGAATVRYAGSPKLKQSVSGAGTLEQIRQTR